MEQHVECLRRTAGGGQRQLHLDLGSRQEEDGMGKVRGDAKRTEWEGWQSSKIQCREGWGTGPFES